MFSTLNPIEQNVETLRQAMDRLVDQAFVGGPFRTIWSRNWSAMPLNVAVTDQDVVVFAAVPGMKPDDLDVTVHQNVLTLGGVIQPNATYQGLQNAAWYLRELPAGQFRRSLTLPFEVDADNAEATFENGIVKIVVPKAEHAKPRKIAIKTAEPQAISAGATEH